MFDLLYNFCLKRFSFYEEFSEIISYKYASLHVKYPLLFLDFHKTLFRGGADFRKIQKYRNSWKYVQWEPVYSMRMEGQTDIQRDTHDEAYSLFSQFFTIVY